MKEVVATSGVNLRLIAGDAATEVELYSQEGLEFVAALWVKLAAEYRLMYEPTWLGIPVIQLPSDIVMLQELIWQLRPDVIVETGVAHGGGVVLYASMCQLVGHGHVIGVDIEIRPHNRAAIENHPLADRISLVEGSSTDPDTFAAVERVCAGARNVMVVLDSNHSTDHVYREMEMYGRLVPPGGYMVVMDGAQAHVWDIPRGKAEWRDSNPLLAIRRFLGEHAEFRSDPYYTRLHITQSPEGFLRRLR